MVGALPDPLRFWLRWAREAVKLVACAAYDIGRYLRHSATVDPYGSKARFRATLQKHQHIVEKGLSLPAPRPGFGVENIRLLTSEVAAYVERFGPDGLAAACVGALRAYHAFNQRAGVASPVAIEVLAALEQRVFSRAALGGECASEGCFGGVDWLRAADLEQAGRGGFEEVAGSRRSVRNFRSEVVPAAEVLAATRVAQSTPSVCNRQAWRVHCYQGEDACRPLLEIQTGNRGFTETIKTLLIVTCRLSAFMSAGERNEAYIDGGMFSMSLVYALHARGVGSCCLNLCLEPRDDRRFHLVGDIPDEEVLVMAIAIGYLPEALAIAQSKRGPVEEVLKFHTAEAKSGHGFGATTRAGSAS